ncbi:MAG: hypothetical protein JSV25_02995 [Spirochaetota bacterium]|nr:MAG: hypothetical protein JSV25_02995 [Spirochaetota bacterium]
MKKKDFFQLIEQSIQLELKVADLYKILSSFFPEDTNFWMQLHEEEKRHASLISKGYVHLSRRRFPLELIASSIQELIEKNNKLDQLIKEYNKNPPSREVAFKKAIDIEKSAGEFHFQQAVTYSPSSRIMGVFQQLNKDDKDHERRIIDYMNDKII